MKVKIHFQSLCWLCYLIVASFFTTVSAQESITVWVFPGGTYDASTLKVTNFSVGTDCASFGSNDYNNAVSQITGGLTSRVFKIGGAFNIPDGFLATEVTMYGWPRYSGTTNIRQLEMDGKITNWSAGTSPYVFADCGTVDATNRTKENCTIHKIAEISEENPVTKSFATPVSGETHAFYKIVLKSSGAFDLNMPAFPGAEGHGRFTVGGRGGDVVKVTNLQDYANGESPIIGSLRWALDQPSPKTIVFDVSGTIHLKRGLGTGKDNVTIAGQTSPGGICIADDGFSVSSNNVIIRFLTFRPGDASGGEPDGLGGMDRSNIIIDHCSVSWSVDECLSVYGMENLSVQWCIAAEPLRLSTHVKSAHCYGGNWGGNKASYHHNLIAHSESRTPRLGPRPTTQENEYVDIRNNVFYNWAGNGCYGGEGMKVNMVNNFYKPGPATDQASATVKYRIAGLGIRTQSYIETFPAFAPMLHVWGKFYINGNKMDGNAEVTNDNWTKGVYGQTTNGSGNDFTWTETTKDTIRLREPLETGLITTHTADGAYEKVLLYAGNSLYRDATDTRIITDVRNRAASTNVIGNKRGHINTPYDTKPANAPAGWSPWLPDLAVTAPVDTDGDGMPDTWEDTNGLDKNNSDDGKTRDEEGYTNLEVYLNSLVEEIVEKQNEEGEVSAIPQRPIIDSNVQIVGNVVYAEAQRMAVYSINGTLLESVQNVNVFSMERFEKGVYIIQVTDQNGNASTHKFLR